MLLKNYRAIQKATKYFTDGGFSKLIIKDEIINKNNRDYLDLLSQIYDNDLKKWKIWNSFNFLLLKKKKNILLWIFLKID